jgi:hypothetical protein
VSSHFSTAERTYPVLIPPSGIARYPLCIHRQTLYPSLVLADVAAATSPLRLALVSPKMPTMVVSARNDDPVEMQKPHLVARRGISGTPHFSINNPASRADSTDATSSVSFSSSATPILSPPSQPPLVDPHEARRILRESQSGDSVLSMAQAAVCLRVLAAFMARHPIEVVDRQRAALVYTETYCPNQISPPSDYVACAGGPHRAFPSAVECGRPTTYGFGAVAPHRSYRVGPPTYARATVFHSCVEPTISLPKFILDMARRSGYGGDGIATGLALLGRYVHATGQPPTPLLIHRLLATCIIVGMKGLNDLFVRNDYMADIVGLPLKELNALEVALLHAIHFAAIPSASEVSSVCQELLQLAATMSSFGSVDCDGYDNSTGSRLFASQAPLLAALSCRLSPQGSQQQTRGDGHGPTPREHYASISPTSHLSRSNSDTSVRDCDDA